MNLRDQNISIQSFRRSRTLSALEVRQCALQIDILLTLRMKIILWSTFASKNSFLYTGSAAVYRPTTSI